HEQEPRDQHERRPDLVEGVEHRPGVPKTGDRQPRVPLRPMTGAASRVMVVALVVVLLEGCGGGPKVLLPLDQSSGLRDTALAVTATGLRPGQVVSLAAQELDSAGQLWRSVLREQADRHGRIALRHTLLEGLLKPASSARPAYLPVRSTITV